MVSWYEGAVFSGLIAIMATEIERKFIVAGEEWRHLAQESRRLRQAYLHADGRSSIRIRIEDQGRAFLTIKSASAGTTRSEFEYAIPVPDAEEMLGLRVAGLVEKTRHIVPAGPITWEIDEFEGDNAGLVLAEVELSHASQQIELPAWAGEEVTFDVRYYNSSLALRPFASWQDAACEED